MMINNKRSNARKACVVALVASVANLAGWPTRRRGSSKRRVGERRSASTKFAIQRRSSTMLVARVVNFRTPCHTPYAAGRFEFKVCPSSSAEDACKRGSGGCAGLTSFKLRMRNDGLSMGRDLTAEPAGRMWASCSAHGPGHEWTNGELRSLTSGPDQADCETFTVATIGKRRPSLADICQQKVKIVENSGWTVVDTAAKPDSCLVTLVTANGRVGYTVVGGDDLSPHPKDEKKGLGTASGGPSRAGLSSLPHCRQRHLTDQGPARQATDRGPAWQATDRGPAFRTTAPGDVG